MGNQKQHTAMFCPFRQAFALPSVEGNLEVINTCFAALTEWHLVWCRCVYVPGVGAISYLCLPWSRSGSAESINIISF